MGKANQILKRLHEQVRDVSFFVRHRRNPRAFTRLRKLSFVIVVAMIIKMIRQSLQIECNLLADRLDMDEPVSKQAFSKARYQISYTGFQALNHTLLTELYTDNNEGIWKGYRILGLDGSTIRLPESKELEKSFGRWDRGVDRNENCPIIGRISQVVELTTGVIVDAELAPPEFGEETLADEQIERVCDLFSEIGQGKLLFVFDRGYPSIALIQQLISAKSDFTFRLPRNFNTAVSKALKSSKTDMLFQFTKELPLLRLIRKTLSSGEECILLTSLIDDQVFDSEDLFEVYRMRWTGCEEVLAAMLK